MGDFFLFLLIVILGIQQHYDYIFLRLNRYFFFRNFYCYSRLYYFDKSKYLVSRKIFSLLFKFAVLFWLLDLFHMIDLNFIWTLKFKKMTIIIDVYPFYLFFIGIMRCIIVIIGFSWVGARSLLLFFFIFSSDYRLLSTRNGNIDIFYFFIFIIDFFINFSLFLFIYYLV